MQKTWEETDRLVEIADKEEKHAKLWWIWAKSIGLLLLGTAILAILAEPLIHSVQNFSNSVSIPSFFISFVLVPWATNARGAAAAIKAAQRKRPRTTSLTFSEVRSLPSFSFLILEERIRSILTELGCRLFSSLLVGCRYMEGCS